MEQRHLAHADRLWPLGCDISGNLDDRIVRQISNCPAVFHHHQMTAPQVEGQRAGDIDDKLAVNANVEGIRQDPGTLIFFGCGKQLFLTPVHHFVSAGVVRVLMLDNLVQHQVVLQIRVRQILREVIHDRLDVAPGFHPRRIGVLRVGFGGIFRQQTKLRDMFTQLRQLVLAVHQHTGKPAEVIQPKVVHLQLAAINPQNGSHVTHCSNRHIANIQHAGVWPQTTHPLCDDCRRVGVVYDPCFFMRVAIYQIDKLDHWQDRTQPVSQPAGAAGLLTNHAVSQRDLLILLAHFILANAHLGEDEVCAAEGHFRVIGDGKFDALAVVADHFFHHRGNRVLTRLVDVVEADFGQWEVLQTHHQAFHNTWRVGATAASNRQNEWGCKHL